MERMIVMNIPYVFKKCSKCGEWLVASTVNFKKAKAGKYKLYSKCKMCEREYRLKNQGYMQQYYQNNKDKIKYQQKKYYEKHKKDILNKNKEYRNKNKEKISEYEKNYRIQNHEHILKRNRQHYQNNKESILKQHKQYYEANKNTILLQHKQYYEKHKEHLSECKKQYYEKHKEHLSEYYKDYYNKNKEKISEYKKRYNEQNKEYIREYDKQRNKTLKRKICKFNSTSKRRLKEENQGNGIKQNQWLEMMDYFDWKCAYSNVDLTKENRSIDHIKPISLGGEHEIWNVAPMLKNYNYQKQDKKMLQWYKKQDFFSEERLQKIYEWQEYAYNKWHKNERI
mgnify:FL=1|jgi:hypothetical protein